MEKKERKINREYTEWLLGNGGVGKGWSPGFCSGPNSSCIKILRALNNKNVIAIPNKISNKNLLSHKISARKYDKVLFLFFTMTTSVFILKAEHPSEEFGAEDGKLGTKCVG